MGSRGTILERYRRELELPGLRFAIWPHSNAIHVTDEHERSARAAKSLNIAAITFCGLFIHHNDQILDTDGGIYDRELCFRCLDKMYTEWIKRLKEKKTDARQMTFKF